MTVTFRTTLVRPVGVGTWTFAPIPATVIAEAEFRPRQRVHGTIDGVPFASSLMPRGGGSLFVVVNGAVRERLGKSAGASVELTLGLDGRPPKLLVPPDLSRALAGSPAARRFFEGLAPSHRKAYLDWIAGAKRAETRTRRVQDAVARLAAGTKLK